MRVHPQLPKVCLANCLKIQACFLDGASRHLVADFICACNSAARCSLWTPHHKYG